MSIVLLDTSGLLAFHSAEEPEHAEAVAKFKSARRKLTHSYVLAELIALATSRGVARQPMFRFVRELIANPRVQVVWVDQSLHERALSLLELRQDKRYSLADAVSFVIMRDTDVANALTTDHHFEQEGFSRLL